MSKDTRRRPVSAVNPAQMTEEQRRAKWHRENEKLKEVPPGYGEDLRAPAFWYIAVQLIVINGIGQMFMGSLGQLLGTLGKSSDYRTNTVMAY